MSTDQRLPAALLAPLLTLMLQPVAMATAASEPAQTAQRATISIVGDGPYYRLTLPTTIYAGAAHTDLRDVRIRNADGNLAPYAWIANETTEAQIQSQKVAIFPIKPGNKDSTAKPADLSLEFQQNADGSLLSIKTQAPVVSDRKSDWIIDASRIDGSLLQARFVLEENAEGLFPLNIEASDDLRYWQVIKSNEQLAILKRDEQKIERLQIDLAGIRAKYLRLRWRDRDAASAILSVTIDSLQRNEVQPPMQWSAPIAATTCGENYCDYLTPAKMPIDSLRIPLSDTNSLASVTLLGQLATPNAYQSRHQRNPLYILRHKRPASADGTTQSQWIPFAQAVVYRLKLTNGEISSDDLAMDGSLFTRLRVQTQGPISLLGQTPPRIAVASIPRSLIFLGRGSPPFTLHWGVDEKQGQALPLATLIPAHRPETPITASNATVDLPLQKSGPLATKDNTEAQAEAPKPTQREWLWAVLAAGLILLAGMAWSLFKAIDKPENADRGNGQS